MKKGNYKLLTKKAYDSVSKEYVERDQGVTPETFDVKNALKHFIELLPPHAKVLDVGSGGGRDAQFLFKHGLRVVGIDFSKQMIKEAQKIAPKVVYKVMDFERLKFKREEFDGVWANASLHHIPKFRLKRVLKNIYGILKNTGILFIKVKYGKGEGVRENVKFEKQIRRYFAFYKSRELSAIIKNAGFEIFSVHINSGREWMDVFAKKQAYKR